MKPALFVRPFTRLGIIVAFVVTTTAAGLAGQEREYQPIEGQPGKDVVWVPTGDALVETMLGMAKVGPGDSVIDLGSGDGRTVIAAARRGARAVGVELNHDLVLLSRRSAAREGMAERATFTETDLFEMDLSRANVITMFLLPSINLKLRPKLLELAAGTRIVSNSFSMADWEPDQRIVLDDCEHWCAALLWIVPAKVGGIWTLDDGELELDQEFQRVAGHLRVGHRTMTVTDGRISGTRVRFSAGGLQYAADVSGDAMSGTVSSAEGTRPWGAVRVARPAPVR